jgi:rod shape-determining protein MreC
MILNGVRKTMLVSVGAIGHIFGSIESYLNLREINRQLALENTRLAFENFQIQDAILENIRLRQVLQFKHELQYDLIPAKVIGFSPVDIVSGLLLSTEDIARVQKNNAVITADGLVGKIVEISGRYAICQILLDPNSRISARLQRNRELGMVIWDGANALLLDYIPNTVSVKPGDVLFTSGLSMIFPSNIKIGTVSEVEISTEKLFQTIKVQSAVSFNRLEEVFIVQVVESNEP